MIKTITKIGNSQGVMMDAALMDLARLKVGDQVNVTVHEGGGDRVDAGAEDDCAQAGGGSSQTID